MSGSIKTTGTMRILTNKFIEYRKEYNENRSHDRIEVGGSLSDNGKTR
jgi:hypothetical protein